MPTAAGFKWGTTSGNLNQTASAPVSGTSGELSATLTNLSAGTTYYYKAFVTVSGTGDYSSQSQTFYGEVCSFTTSSAPSLPAYLTGYGMPDVSGIYNGLRASGNYSGKSDDWYSYSTTSSKRQIAVHTYNSTVNYVVLYDETKYAPVWTAHTMNNTTWPRNGVGRNESWGEDPAISLKQQSGVNGYSKGHLVASNYRQTAVDQNKQTFYYSNQAPQWQNSFNSGVWSTLEERVVAVSTTGTTMIYVITGVLYEGSSSTASCGDLSVPIPSHFYKCIMRCTFSGGTITGAQGIAFVYTNEAHSGDYYDSTYVTSIDAIETRAGFDFFAAVPDDIEATAEANTSHSWFTGK